MKWTHVGWLLAGLLTASASLRAADVTLTVNGKVVARPCTVSTVNATVELGDLYTFSLIGAGSASAPAQRGAGSEQLPRGYFTGESHLQRNGGQHRLLQKPGNGGQYSARTAERGRHHAEQWQQPVGTGG